MGVTAGRVCLGKGSRGRGGGTWRSNDIIAYRVQRHRVAGQALRGSAHGRLQTGGVANGWPPTWSSVEGKACLLDEFWVEVDEWIKPHSVIGVGEGGRVFREGRVLCELSAFAWGKKNTQKKLTVVHSCPHACSHPRACTHSHPCDR